VKAIAAITFPFISLVFAIYANVSSSNQSECVCLCVYEKKEASGREVQQGLPCTVLKACLKRKRAKSLKMIPFVFFSYDFLGEFTFSLKIDY